MTPTTTTPQTLPELLRSQTKARHDALEQNAFGKALATGSLTPELYRQQLVRFYAFHKAVEPLLAAGVAAHAIPLPFHEMQKLNLLEKDLRFLGLSDTEIAAIAPCTDLPPLQTADQVWAMLYVLEGSTMGGRFITKRVGDILGYTPDTGCAYFNSYGIAELHVRWGAFVQALTAYGATANHDAVLQATDAAYLSLERWLGA